MDTQYAIPPIDALMPVALQKQFLISSLVILAGFILWGLVKLFRDKDPLMLLAMLGGLISIIWEPIVDVLGLCWHPIIGQITAFEALGRKIPMVLPAVNPWYFGGVGALLYYRFKKGVTMGWVFKTWGILLIVAFLIEVVPLSKGTWIYYGDQPLKFAGFPFWWSFVNEGGVLMTGTLIYASRTYIKNPVVQMFGIIFAAPIGDGISNAGTGWPVWFTLNLPHDAFISGYAATLPAAALTIALSVLMIYFCAIFLTHRPPARA